MDRGWILKKSLYAGALAGITAASGDIIKGLKGLKEKQAVAKSAANQQKFNKMLAETTGSTLPDKVAQAKSGADFIAKADLSTVGAPAAATETVASTSQAIAPESQFGEAMALEKGELARAEAAFDMKISKSRASEMAADPYFTSDKMTERYKSAYPKGQSVPSLTPEMDKVVPNLFDNFMAGVKDEATKRATQSVLASGAYGLYQHRPELESLKKFNIVDPRKIV